MVISSETKTINDTLNERISNIPENLDKFNEQPWVVLTQTILVPVTIAIVGFAFTAAQFIITNARQDSDSADKARETKEQILTDYAKTISELLTKNNLRNGDNGSVKNIARGQTLIALRRLTPDEQGKDDRFTIDNDNKSKDDEGQLKGLLIRYLYENQLIGHNSNSGKGDEKLIIDLSGANITKVALEAAWLPGIALQKAWLNKGNFKNAYLMGAKLYQDSLMNADFTGADLSNADFTSADLRFANFKKAKNLDPTKFQNACYAKNTEAKYFPVDFSPNEVGMVPIDEAKSDPVKANFERCRYVFLAPKP
jgi:hypothetical protein